MEKQGWKILAIVFVTLFLLETIAVIKIGQWAYAEVDREIEQEYECVYNFCSDYESYFYDPYTSVCECYEGSELKDSKYLS